jgi:peptidoglycan/LPS O-acetylase OafA/YrhL
MFFLLSGYSISLSPCKSIRDGAPERALSSISSSCFRRALRLFLPVIASTFLAMFGAQLRLFENSIPGFVPMKPEVCENLWLQYLDWSSYLWSWLLDGWHWPSQDPFSTYGAHLWTIPVIFRGSLLIFTVMLALARLRHRPRIVILFGLLIYSLYWSQGDAVLFLSGTLLAHSKAQPEVLLPRTNSTYKLIKETAWTLSLLLGAYMASYPENGATVLDGYPFHPFNQRWTWYIIGTIFIASSAVHCHWLRPILEAKGLLYVGKISFSLYIVHEPLLQIFGWPVTYSIRHTLERWPLTTDFVTVLLIWPIITAMIITCADLFWRHVEMPSAAFASWLESTLLSSATAPEAYWPIVDYELVEGRKPEFTESVSEAGDLSNIYDAEMQPTPRRRPRYRHSNIVGITLFFLVVFTGMLAQPFTNSYSPFIRYPTPKQNKGPRFQEMLSPSNVTTWLLPFKSMDDYISRLDDQTILLNSSFTAYEVRIREWFAQHYPQLEQVVQNGLNLNSTYLGPPKTQRQFPIDDRFHVTHCVVALRRFWKALDEGVHVAPRDMDMAHLNHCLAQLERFSMDDNHWCKDSGMFLQWETMVVW